MGNQYRSSRDSRVRWYMLLHRTIRGLVAAAFLLIFAPIVGWLLLHTELPYEVNWLGLIQASMLWGIGCVVTAYLIERFLLP